MTVTTSPFFGIQYGWTTGQSGWGDPVNTNLKVMSFLDKGAVDDFVSSLPGSPTTGSSYVLTTDNLLYVRFAEGWVFITPQTGMEVTKLSDGTKQQWIGSAWADVTKVKKSELAQSTGSNLVGHISSATGAVSRTVKNKIQEVVYVEDFGAVGDGVTLDAAAINLAMASGAKVVNLNGSKTYKLESDIHVYSGQRLNGNGASLFSDLALNFMVRNHDIDQPNYTGGSNIVIENIVFDGSLGVSQCGAIGLAHTLNTTVRNCVFKNLNLNTLHCIDSSGNNKLTVQNNYFDNCSGATIVQVDAATTGSMPTFTAPFLETASATRSKNALITGNKFYQCGGTTDQCVHLHKKGHDGVTITDNVFDECYRAISDDLGSTYRSNGPTTNIIIKGNTIKTSLTGGGIFLDFVKRVAITDNIIEGTGGGIQVLNYDLNPRTITSITNASPGVVTTSVAHGYSNGNVIYIAGASGMTQINNRYYSVANVTSTTFTLVDLSTSVAVDTTAYGVYTSGATSTFKNFTSTSRSEDVVIKNNIMTCTNSDAIVVENCADTTVVGNIINEFGELNDNRSAIKFDVCFPLNCQDNTIGSTTSGTKDGIAIYRSYRYKVVANTVANTRYAIRFEKLNETNTDRGVISDNTLLLGTTYSMFLKGTSAFPISRITVNGNLIVGQFGGNTIRAESGTNITVSGNTIEQVANSASGISMSLCSRCTITGNTVTAQAGSTGTGIAVFGSGSSGRSTVVGNVIELFATGVDILTSSANYGTVVGNMFIGITGTATSVGANVQVANNSTE